MTSLDEQHRFLRHRVAVLEEEIGRETNLAVLEVLHEKHIDATIELEELKAALEEE